MRAGSFVSFVRATSTVRTESGFGFGASTSFTGSGTGDGATPCGDAAENRSRNVSVVSGETVSGADIAGGSRLATRALSIDSGQREATTSDARRTTGASKLRLARCG